MSAVDWIQSGVLLLILWIVWRIKRLFAWKTPDGRYDWHKHYDGCIDRQVNENLYWKNQCLIAVKEVTNAHKGIARLNRKLNRLRGPRWEKLDKRITGDKHREALLRYGLYFKYQRMKPADMLRRPMHSDYQILKKD